MRGHDCTDHDFFVQEVRIMANEDKQAFFIKELQTRFDGKLKEQELSIVEHWKSHIDKVLALKPEGIASLQLQIRRISDMMSNRIKILKKE
jgi:hypothetical protein